MRFRITSIESVRFRASQTREVDSYDDFKVEIEKVVSLLCHWDRTPETERAD